MNSVVCDADNESLERAAFEVVVYEYPVNVGPSKYIILASFGTQITYYIGRWIAQIINFITEFIITQTLVQEFGSTCNAGTSSIKFPFRILSGPVKM